VSKRGNCALSGVDAVVFSLENEKRRRLREDECHHHESAAAEEPDGTAASRPTQAAAANLTPRCAKSFYASCIARALILATRR